MCVISSVYESNIKVTLITKFETILVPCKVNVYQPEHFHNKADQQPHFVFTACQTMRH